MTIATTTMPRWTLLSLLATVVVLALVAVPCRALVTPKFDAATQRWIPNPKDDGVNPYGPVGALLRHGPSPFVQRIINADQYEQGILKYMAVAKVSRSEAVGNMDAKLNNAVDWAYQKMQEKKGKPKVDYTRLDKKQAALTTVWAVFITPLALQVIFQTVQQATSH